MTTKKAQQQQNILRRLMKSFTKKQKDFLIARMETTSDADACEESDVGVSSPPRWKRDDDFEQAYELAIQIAKTNREVFIPEADIEKMSEGQLDAFQSVLPQIFQEHIRLALHAQSENVRIRAIQDIYDRLGIEKKAGAEALEGKNVFVQLVQMMKPQIEAHSPKDVEDGNVLEGRIRELDRG